MPSRTCLFTIVSRNYLHFACTLMESVAVHAPWMERVVCLCDSDEGLDPAAFDFRLMTIRDLTIPDIDNFIFQYSILELNTAIKPFVFEHLAKQGRHDHLFYFDPDIRVFDSLQAMDAMLDRCEILLTPHLTGQLDDGKHPNELAILQSGTYNLGYLGLRNSPEALKLMRWWQSKMLRDCVVDIPRGLFVDQKWMDMVPGMFSGVHIERHPGWNTAYWNINHRAVEAHNERFTVEGQPLVFFHFSGVGLDGKSFSKHQDRYSVETLPPAVRTLMNGYVEALRRHDGARFAKIPYAFSCFANGDPIPDMARVLFRENQDQLGLDMRRAEHQQRFIDYANEPAQYIGRSHPLVTRLAHTLYMRRSDLQLAFPDVFGDDAGRYGRWFCENAKEQARIPECFIKPIRLHFEAGDATPAEHIETRQKHRLPSNFWRTLYGPIWRSRGVLRRFVSYERRHKLHAWLLRAAFDQGTPARQKAAPATTTEAQPFGLNLVGYLHAESGVGQSARASVAAAQAVGLPLAALDFRVGNVSRMDADPGIALADSPRYRYSLLHINADQLGLAGQTLGSDFFAGRYNIGYWAWELPSFPDEWRNAAKQVDEIWVPSEFCQQAISAAVDVPVLCMPHCIRAPAPTSISRAALGLPEDGFLFGFMFDVLSIVERKNPLALIEAFRRAFGRNHAHARLILKLSNVDHNPEFMARLNALVGDDDSIRVVSQYFSRAEIDSLLSHLDCYVSLHRSEGFGLTIAESMLLGKPVIATGWSGNMTFMTPWNSIPVRFDLVELEHDYGPYKKGSVWAEPSIEDAAESMRRILDDEMLRNRLGQSAHASIKQHFSPAALGARMRSRLDALDLMR